MNKTAIKNFAIWARNKLRADIILKAGLLGITDKGIVEPQKPTADDLQIFDIGTSQPVQLKGRTAIEQRDSLVAAIKAKHLKQSEAFDAVIEEVAYTWFNRLIAVRFMEVNDYLPSRVRVLSSENPAKAEPDFVTNPFDTDLEFTPAELDLIDELKDHNKSDELFQFLFIKQCNKLNEILPELFEKTNDYTELLLNVSFTDKDGVVYHLVHDISEDDFNIEKQGQVEIIGWLYQYYNTEPKDKVFGRPSGQKIRKEDVPAATQLFTPDWIVRYMVENSLGRIAIHNLKYGDWLDSEKAKIDIFKSKWKYYLEEAEQSQEIIDRFRFEESNKYNRGDVPPYVDSTFLDPCMGSGHILVYAFDVFMDIYKAQGYTERDAAQRIVEKNLYGLELDDRATQLAYFAVMMKARSYDRRFLTRGIRPNLCSIQESNSLNTDYLELFGDLKHVAQKLVDEFIDAKEYGSILNLSISVDEIAQLERKYAEIDETIYDNIFDTIRQVGLRTNFVPLIKQAKIMIRKYEVVCTNPPYMGRRKSINQNLAQYLDLYYKEGKMDLFSTFILSNISATKKDGYIAMMTPYVWLYLNSFVELREKLEEEIYIQSIIQLEKAAFSDAAVSIATFVMRKKHLNYLCSGINLEKFKGEENQPVKVLEAIENPKCGYLYETQMDTFRQIPDTRFVFWIPKKTIDIFQEPDFETYVSVKQGITTSDNNRFLRFWNEVCFEKIGFNLSQKEAITSGKKWFPYSKGGEIRKWFGNNYYVINYENDGLELKAFHEIINKDHPGGRLKNREYYFLKNITWSDICGTNFAVRVNEQGFLFDVKGSCGFVNDEINYLYIVAFMNTKIVNTFCNILNPSVTTQVGDIKQIPLKIQANERERIDSLTIQSINNSKLDWDSFETSWDFKKHPFVINSLSAFGEDFEKTHCILLSDVYRAWESECNERFNQLKSNEEELNRIFIDIYGLQDELTPEVEDKDVTVRKADLQRDMRSFVSYAVGCMFGRYSIDREGLVFAGGDFDKTYWRFQGQAALDDNGNPIQGAYAGMSNAEIHYPRFMDSNNWENATQLRYEPDADNCIPITDTAYFEDDIVGRFCEFVKVVFGEDTLEANLEFVAKALGNRGNSSRDIIRTYFLNDFFKDHCKIYQKRPIYWLFDSGKQNGFKALVYMHRWNADTIGNMRVEYLHRIQRTYEKEIEREQDTIDNTTNNRDRATATKRKEKLLKQLKEAKDYDAKVAHLALSRPDIDLDDGVKVNYEKVQTAQDGKKLQILAKI